ncbi:Cell growth-regulating nucleolar protein, partial [Galemys pyrenaicus]
MYKGRSDYGGKDCEGNIYKGNTQGIRKLNKLIESPNVSAKVRELLRANEWFSQHFQEKVKFQNWMKNSLKVHNKSILEQEARATTSNLVANAHTKISAEVPSPKVNESIEKPAEVKETGKERKEEWLKSNGGRDFLRSKHLKTMRHLQ